MHRRHRLGPVGITTVVCAFFSASSAHAGFPGAGAAALIYGGGIVAEHLVPDLRLELGEPVPKGILSWPLHPYAVAFRGNKYNSNYLYVSPFIEPQLAPASEARFRLLGGLRLGADVFGGPPIRPGGSRPTALAVFAEGAARWQPAGMGAVVGVGVGLSFLPVSTVAVVARRSWTPGGVRHDAALDVTYPLNGSPWFQR
jgi:hypothetical protein